MISRDKKCLPLIPQGSISTLYHVGDLDPVSQLHRIKSLLYPQGLFTGFKNKLGEQFSDSDSRN